MKKISAFYAFLAFVLVGASMAVVPAHAGGTFCIYGKKSGGGNNPSSLKLKQIESTASTTECTVAHYDSWALAYNYLNGWASNPSNQADGSFIEITSDIVFAGKSTGGVTTSCNTGNDAFDGKILDLKDKIALVGSSATSNYKISGLCYITDAVADVGFVKGAKKIENLDFENVYFKSTMSNSNVGIVANNSQSENHVYQNIHVKNSSFYGYYAGAVLGNGAAYISNISLTSDTITSGNYGGGVVGYLVTNLLENDDGSTNDVYSGFNVDDLRMRTITGKTGGEVYVGGIAGFVSQKEKVKWTKSSLDGLDIQNASYAGGLLGMVDYQDVASVAGETEYSEIDVSSKSNAIIKATKHVGGLVGYINENSNLVSLLFAKNSVRASVQGGGSSADSYVGGLVGFINYTKSEKMGLTIFYNKITNAVYGGASGKVGYLIGSMECTNVDFESVQYNFYYGNSTSLATNEAQIGIGSFDVSGNWLNGTIQGTHVNVSHNFRNAVSGLTADGELVNETKPVKKSATVSFYNGVITAAEMKTDDFVTVLNSGNPTKPFVLNGTGDAYGMPTLNPNSSTPAPIVLYNVTFDLSTLDDDSYVVFGNAWTTNNWENSLEMKASKNSSSIDDDSYFPKAYIYESSTFRRLLWKYDATSTDSYDYLDASKLGGTDVTMYAAYNQTISTVSKRAIKVVAVDENGNELYGDDDYHGSVVLSQTVGGKDFKQTSEIYKSAEGDYYHRMFVPSVNDTLTFELTLVPDQGYSMTYVSFSSDWVYPSGQNWGYSSGTFKFQPVKMTTPVVKVMFEKTSIDPVYVAYDLSLKKTAEDSANTYLPVDAKTSQMVELASATDEKVLWMPYRTDKCFAGWSLKPEATRAATDPVYKKINKANVSNFSVDETKPTTLYAAWETCSSTPVKKINVQYSSSNSTLVLFQKFGDAYLRHKVENFGISLVAGSYDFYIDTERSVPDLGYKFKSDYTLYYIVSQTNKNVLPENDAWRVEWISGSNRNYIFSIDVSKVTYELVFNENAGSDKALFGDSWKDIWTNGNFAADADGNWTVKLSYTVSAVGKESGKFPTAIYRDGKCLDGFTFDKDDNTNGVYSAFTEAFMQKYAALNATAPTTMYAYWKTCTQDGFTIYSADSDKGTLVLKKKFALGGSNETTEHSYKVGANGLKIPAANSDISFTGISFEINDNAGYVMDPDKSYTYRKHGSTDEWITLTGALLNTDLDIKAPIIMDLLNSTYALDVNADDVFFGDGFEKSLWTAVAYGDKLPTNIYRTDATLAGWSFDKDATADKAMTVFDKNFVETFESYDNANQFGVNFDPTKNVYPVLFAVWKTGVVSTHSVKSDDANKGKLTLEQTLDSKKYTHDVVKELLVPAVDGGLNFTVHYEDGSGWKLENGESIVWKNTSDLKTAIENGTVKNVDGDYVVSALEKFMEFNLVFDASSEDQLFHGEDWTKELDNVKVSDQTITTFPTMAYTTDRCIAGWSVTPNGTVYTEMNDALAEEIYAAYPKLDNTTKINLYAHWTDDVEGCAGKLASVTVEAKNGYIQVVETSGSDKNVHTIDENGQVMLPSEIDSDKWTVHAVPDSSYVLDSLVVTKNGTVVAVLHEGDKLPKDLDEVVLTAYFGKENKTPIKIVDNNLKMSGNTLQFDFSSSKFEVTRGVTVDLKVIDVNADTVVYKLSADSVASAYANSVKIRVVNPGDYKAVLSFSDGVETSDTVVFFTVASPFVSFEPETWQMLSVAAVDTAKLSWDESKFYWWDEGGVGEFWQYKQIRRGDTIEASRGVWYSSRNDKPLVVRKNYKDEGKDIEWNLECVRTGWNLVANPHGWYVDLYSKNESARKNANEQSDIYFVRYDAKTHGYVSVDTIRPYEAVWAHVSKPMKWVVSAEPVFVSEAYDQIVGDKAMAKLAKASSNNNWTMQLVLTDDNGRRDSWNLLGASDQPFVVVEPPAGMGDRVNLSIVDGKRSLAKSLKAPSEDMEWTVALSASNERKGYLTFDGIEDVISLGYHVYVTVDGETTELQNAKPLPVLLKSNSKTATVRVAKNGSVVAAKRELVKGLRSVKLGNKLQVSFDAHESLVGSKARVELLDVKGKVVATSSARAVLGTNEMSMNLPKMGVYILRVRVGTQKLSSRILVK